MKKILAFCTLMIAVFAKGQNIGIGTTAPHASARLEISATNKGLLIPRVTQANRPASAATGLLIYQTDNTPGFYYFDGSNWKMLGGSGFSLPYTGSTASNNALDITSTTGVAIVGTSSAATGNWYGGQFMSASADGSGVYGVATANSGLAYGGNFQSLSTSGRGVYAEASAANGFTYGVYGMAKSIYGTGVYGVSTTLDSKNGLGYGVYGRALGGYGVYGQSDSGVGVHGYSGRPSNGIGVYGYVNDLGNGVEGVAEASWMGRPIGNGVVGRSNSAAGVLGLSATGPSIKGFKRFSTGNAGLFEIENDTSVAAAVMASSTGINGMALSAVASNTSGTTTGIRAESKSPNGTAAYITNSGGGWSLLVNDGPVKIGNLSGTGTRMVVADATGRLSTMAISSDNNWVRNGNDIASANSGNVGIGVSNPTRKLEVNGNVFFKTTSTANQPQLTLLENTAGNLARLVFKNATATTGWTIAALNTLESPNIDVLNFNHSLMGNLLDMNSAGRINANVPMVAQQSITGRSLTEGRAGVKAEYAGPGANNALEVENGFIKVSGYNRTAFQVTSSAANTSANFTSIAYVGAQPTDIVIVTPVYTISYLNAPIGVWFNNGNWFIFRQDLAAMPMNILFNIMVIKQ